MENEGKSSGTQLIQDLQNDGVLKVVEYKPPPGAERDAPARPQGGIDQRLRALFGLCAGQYPSRLRIGRACDLLRHIEAPVSELALECAYARILLALTLIGAVGWIALSPGGLDREGKPIGTDFIGFYTASRLALDGRPELAYDVGAHWAAQKALYGPEVGYTAFFYPPPALLISLPLALAPFFWSLAAWLATTGYAFYRVLQLYAPTLDPVAFLAFPAVFVNAAHGQNGFLSAALIGGGLIAMDTRSSSCGGRQQAASLSRAMDAGDRRLRLGGLRSRQEGSATIDRGKAPNRLTSLHSAFAARPQR